MLRATQRLAANLVEGRSRDITVDGFKRVYEDHSWLLFRKSGTEPLIRVYSDAPTKERAEELANKGEALLQECL
jgi:phosphomannomutase